jgi:hypothetical protein
MLTYTELNNQNHRITELSNALSYLIQDRQMCDNSVTCDVFMSFAENVKTHLENQERHLYGKLLTHHEKKVSSTAGQFMSGSQEVKKIFSSYLRKWCDQPKGRLKIKDHAAFVRDTEDMLDMVLKRIQDETERLYPLLREFDEEHVLVAA